MYWGDGILPSVGLALLIIVFFISKIQVDILFLLVDFFKICSFTNLNDDDDEREFAIP